MPGMNALSAATLAAAAVGSSGATSPRQLQGAFAGAANVPRDVLGTMPSAGERLAGAFRRVGAWMRGGLFHVCPTQRRSDVDGYDLQALSIWERSGAPSERRAEAAAAIRSVVANGEPALRLRGMRLEALPEIPRCVTTLDCSHNALHRLPRLPMSLRVLNVCHNPLRIWPEFPRGLDALHAASCGFTRVGRLPGALRSLDLSGNQLTDFPPAGDLPPALNVLSIQHNQLTRLPPGIDSLSNLELVEMEGNPLDAHMRDAIAQWNWGSTGVRFQTEDAVVEAAEREDALCPVAAFHRFLTTLEETVDAERYPEFASDRAEWLARVERDPRRRDLMHAIVPGFRASCEDRVLLTYFEMRRAEAALAFESGQFDHDPAALLAMARRTMREEAVDAITRARIRAIKRDTAKKFDEIETILAYRVGMGDLLPPAGGITTGRYTDKRFSHVTESDLQEARTALRGMDAGFPSYLSSSALWLGALKRTYPEAFAAADAQRAAMSDPEECDARVRAYLRTERPGLEDDADAQREAGPIVMARFNHELFWPLTQRFLQERGASLDLIGEAGR